MSNIKKVKEIELINFTGTISINLEKKTIEKSKNGLPKSKLWGVTATKNGKWMGNIPYNGKSTYIGTFLTEEEAATEIEKAFPLVQKGTFVRKQKKIGPEGNTKYRKYK